MSLQTRKDEARVIRTIETKKCHPITDNDSSDLRKKKEKKNTVAMMSWVEYCN